MPCLLMGRNTAGTITWVSRRVGFYAGCYAIVLKRLHFIEEAHPPGEWRQYGRTTSAKQFWHVTFRGGTVLNHQ
jgi:hypothetical protein